MVNSDVVAAIHILGMRCDPCGAVRWTVQRIAPQGSQPVIMHAYSTVCTQL